VHRSEITIDLGTIRHNARRLLEALEGSQLWAVVKANGYGHGASDVARAALSAGASALCVATLEEGLEFVRLADHLVDLWDVNIGSITDRTLEITFLAAGVEAYVFTFG